VSAAAHVVAVVVKLAAQMIYEMAQTAAGRVMLAIMGGVLVLFLTYQAGKAEGIRAARDEAEKACRARCADVRPLPRPVLPWPFSEFGS